MDEDLKILYLIMFFFVSIVLFVECCILGSGSNNKIFSKKYLRKCLEVDRVLLMLYGVLLFASCVILNSESWI